MDAPLQPPAYAFRPWPPAAAQVVDSYGMVLSSGGMHDFPVAFSTTAPAKFCSPPDGGLSGEQRLALLPALSRGSRRAAPTTPPAAPRLPQSAVSANLSQPSRLRLPLAIGPGAVRGAVRGG